MLDRAGFRRRVRFTLKSRGITGEARQMSGLLRRPARGKRRRPSGNVHHYYIRWHRRASWRPFTRSGLFLVNMSDSCQNADNRIALMRPTGRLVHQSFSPPYMPDGRHE